MFNLRQIITDLQQDNRKAYYLAFLRVAVSAWFLKELFFRWPLFNILYSNKSFFKTDASPSLRVLHLDAVWLREHYLFIVYICLVLLLLNIFGIGRNIVSFLLFIAITLLYSLNTKFANSGDEMAMLLVFYLSFANTFSHFTVVKKKSYPQEKEKLYNLITNLAAYCILFNLCLTYFIAGLFKLQDPSWRNGTAIHYFLNDNRYSVFAFNGHIEIPAVLGYIINYGTIVYEISFGFFVWSGRSRNIILVLGLLMHLCIYLFLMIYGMSVIFIIQYGLFYSNDEITSAVAGMKKMVRWQRRE